MTIIYIENVLGSGQLVTVAETFKSLTIERNLRPGESGRFLVSPRKSIVVNECLLPESAHDDSHPGASIPYFKPKFPRTSTTYSNDE